MEILKSQSQLLSNFEVLQLFEEEYKYHRQMPSTNSGQSPIEKKAAFNIRTVISEVRKHIIGTPAVHQSQEQIQSLLDKLKQFSLYKREKLDILNHRPTQPVELNTVIEELYERFTDDQVDEILSIINECLPNNRT